MRQTALFIAFPAALTAAAALVYTEASDSRSVCEVRRDEAIACAINIGRDRRVTEFDLKHCQDVAEGKVEKRR